MKKNYINSKMLKDIKNEYDNLSNIFYKKGFKDCSYHYYHLKYI